MITELDIARHIAHRGSKALLEIEALAFKVKSVIQSNISAEAKVEALASLNTEILTKVMEGTSSAYKIDPKA